MGYYRSGKAIYFTNTSEDGNTNQELIADCENSEKARFILDRITTHSTYFIKDALVTLSSEFHGDMVSRAEFIGRMNGAIDALNKLDQVKKTLFYGRDNNLNPPEGKRDATNIPENVNSNRAIACDIIHAILGFATEAGELLEALKAAINGHNFDWINVQEELGDAAWYAAILAARGYFTFEDYEQLIIKKLRARYADKFTSAEAVERNLAAERAILEDKEAPLSSEETDAIVDDINSRPNLRPMRDEGDMIANGVSLVPTPPASGKAAVEAIEPQVDAAFEAVKNVSTDGIEDAPVTRGSDGELHKPIAARKHPLPFENLAHQPVRSKDLD